MLTIYHVRGTRSVRPIWLCHELELDFRIETVDFAGGYQNSAEWREISPAGKVPALRDGELTMFESGAMIDYILECYGSGRFRPVPATPESAIYHQWCWFSEATLIRPLGLPRLMRSRSETGEKVAAFAVHKTKESLRALEAALTGKRYLLGGEFTAADIMMGYSLALLQHLKILGADYLALAEYLKRLQQRSAYQKAVSA